MYVSREYELLRGTESDVKISSLMRIARQKVRIPEGFFRFLCTVAFVRNSCEINFNRALEVGKPCFQVKFCFIVVKRINI